MRTDSKITPPRQRPHRSPKEGDEPRRAASTKAEWSGPTRRTKLIAVALAVVVACCTFALVSRTWIHGAPAPKAPGPVEVKLIALPTTSPR